MSRIVLVVKNPGFLRYIETQIALLCERGHQVHIGVQDLPIEDENGLAGDLSRRYANLSVGEAPSREGVWKGPADLIRRALDYCHYLHPEFANAHDLALRARKHAGALGIVIWKLAHLLRLNRSAGAVNVILSTLRGLHDAIPADVTISAYLKQLDADLVILTSLVWPRSPQPDYVLSCRVLGIPTAYSVNSWDNLTNKGDVKAKPDALYVWNEQQAGEAARLHGMAPSAVRVTGAALFDRWFDRTPGEAREDFCKRVGLPDAEPFILYACSSPAIAPGVSEPQFFAKWLAALRASAEPGLANARVLVRPHPFNVDAWRAVFIDDPRVTIHPRHGRWIVRDEDRSEYFNALRYCGAVVGINTSAMLEAAIVGAKTFTLQTGDFAGMQEGTLHFHYLTSLGIVATHSSFAEHFAALGAAVAAADLGANRAPLPGVISFVRPQGGAIESTPIATDTIARDAETLPRTPARKPLTRPIAYVVVRIMRSFTQPKSKKLGFFGQMRRRIARTSIVQKIRHYYARTWFWPMFKLLVGLLPKQHQLIRQIVAKELDPSEQKRLIEVDAAMAKARRGEAPIFVGPWISEVGFEVLYWIPFLQWYKERYQIPDERFVVVSRGGGRDWYRGLIGDRGKYAEIYDILTPDQFREQNVERVGVTGKQKQSRLSDMERELCDEVARNLGIEHYNLLHPRMMFRLFARFWKDMSGHGFMNRYTKFLPFSVDEDKHELLLKRLPARFVVVKFYFRESLPDNAQNRALIKRVILQMAEHIDVVVMGTSVRVDDHADFYKVHGKRIHHIDPMTNPSENLAVQTAIISRAECYVGTYGGMTYVANYLGKTSICFESDAQFNRPTHTEFATRKLAEFGGRLHLLHPDDLAHFDRLFSGMMEPGETESLSNVYALPQPDLVREQ